MRPESGYRLGSERGSPNRGNTLGAGERLFGETSEKKPLRLISTRTIGDGLAFLTYEFVRDA